MVAPINARDIALQNTIPRLLESDSNYILLTANSLQFKYGSSNLPKPSSITITANLIGNLKGAVTFTSTGLSSLPQVNPLFPNKLQITPDLFTSDLATITASIEFLGVTYFSAPISISKVTNTIFARTNRGVDFVNTPANGQVSSLNIPALFIELYNGQNKVTSGITFSPPLQTFDGLTATINTLTGQVELTQALNGWVADSTSFVFTATFNDLEYSTSYTISKIKQGATGTAGAPGALGATGAPGVSAPIVEVSGILPIALSATGVYTPSSLTLTANTENILNPEYSWTVTNAQSVSSTTAKTTVITPKLNPVTVLLSVDGDNLLNPVTNKYLLETIYTGGLGPTIGISGLQNYRINAANTRIPEVAQLTGNASWIVNPQYSWAVTNGTYTTVDEQPNLIQVTPTNTDPVAVTLTVTGDNLPVGGLTKTEYLLTVRDGLRGEAGSNGAMSAFPTIYKWTRSSTAPARPTTTSTYTWGTAGLSNIPATWSSQAPSNTDRGQYLWAITAPLAASANVVSSTADWTNTEYEIRAVAYNGVNGDTGATGANGAPGAAGSAGSATFVVTRFANDSSAPSNSEVTAIVGRGPVAGDICTVSYNNGSDASVYRYVTSWVTFSRYITGSLIVQNSITAESGVIGSIDADKITAGTITGRTYQTNANPAAYERITINENNDNEIKLTGELVSTYIMDTTYNAPGLSLGPNWQTNYSGFVAPGRFQHNPAASPTGAPNDLTGFIDTSALTPGAIYKFTFGDGSRIRMRDHTLTLMGSGITPVVFTTQSNIVHTVISGTTVIFTHNPSDPLVLRATDGLFAMFYGTISQYNFGLLAKLGETTTTFPVQDREVTAPAIFTVNPELSNRVAIRADAGSSYPGIIAASTVVNSEQPGILAYTANSAPALQARGVATSTAIMVGSDKPAYPVGSGIVITDFTNYGINILRRTTDVNGTPTGIGSALSISSTGTVQRPSIHATSNGGRFFVIGGTNTWSWGSTSATVGTPISRASHKTIGAYGDSSTATFRSEGVPIELYHNTTGITLAKTILNSGGLTGLPNIDLLTNTGYSLQAQAKAAAANSVVNLAAFDTTSGTVLTTTKGLIGISATGSSSYGIQAGSITSSSWDFYASGAGINYGPFTGGHDGLFSKSDNIVQGDILIDYALVAKKNLSNTIFHNKISTVTNTRNVVGVLVSRSTLTEENCPAAISSINDDSKKVLPDNFDELCKKYDYITFNAVGEGQVNVCKDGGNIDAGDYITTSNRPGKGMKQSDDLYHNYTVAKARESVVWEAGDDSIKQVACIYLCG